MDHTPPSNPSDEDAPVDVLGFIVQIAKAHSGAQELVGQRSAPLFGPVRIGRSRACDVVLADRSVSARHIQLERRAVDRFYVTNLSQNGATFLDRQRLAPGQTVQADADALWLQVGRLLLHVTALPDTLPVSECLSLPDTSPHNPLLAIRDGAVTEVWLHGQPVALYPSAARVLLCLCRRPGQVATYTELARALDPSDHLSAGGSNIAQCVTYIRRMFLDALDDRLLPLDALHRALALDDAPPASDPRDLLRKVVENVRGVGYQLNLASSSVQLLNPDAPPPRF